MDYGYLQQISYIKNAMIDHRVSGGDFFNRERECTAVNENQKRLGKCDIRYVAYAKVQGEFVARCAMVPGKVITKGA